MSCKSIISVESEIVNFLLNQKFPFYFSKPVVQHIARFIDAAIKKGFNGTVTDIYNLSYADCHRTSVGKFLSKGVWNEKYLKRIIQEESLETIRQLFNQTGSPIFAIYDDTISEKTKPSSQAKNPIAGTGFHHSHTKGKLVWGHQALATILSCNDISFPYEFQRYEKEGLSKIDRVCQIVESLPVPTGPAYGLCDSWYTCPKVIFAHLKKGYHLIGGLKVNRIIYPAGINIQIRDFTQYIFEEDVHLVTVNNSSYWVYRYEGALNKIENAVVLMCWPIDKFKDPGALRAFLSTDVSIDTQVILEYYGKRWPIETFFRENKNLLGLNKYQIRHTKAIDRFWLLMELTYLYCTVGTGTVCSFNLGIKIARKNSLKETIKFIYSAAKSEIPLKQIFKCLKAA